MATNWHSAWHILVTQWMFIKLSEILSLLIWLCSAFISPLNLNSGMKLQLGWQGPVDYSLKQNPVALVPNDPFSEPWENDEPNSHRVNIFQTIGWKSLISWYIQHFHSTSNFSRVDKDAIWAPSSAQQILIMPMTSSWILNIVHRVCGIGKWENYCNS